MKTKPFLIITIIVIGFINSLNAQSVAAGLNSSLFICADSVVWSWGYNAQGQLGTGTTADSVPAPFTISTLSDIVAVAAGQYHSLFLKKNETVWACGLNNNGQVGDGTTIKRTAPVQLNSLTGIIAAAAGYQHSLFVKNDGTVWACGDNSNGQLGVGTTVDSIPVPVQITSLTGTVIAVAAGNAHSLFLKNDGTVWACGDNSNGQLGDETTTQRNTPVKTTLTGTFTAVAAGSAHSLFLKKGGIVLACGDNTNGQLGNGTTTNYISTPMQVSALTAIKAISGGYAHSLFLDADSNAWACGSNVDMQLGVSEIAVNSFTPTQVLTGITAIAAGQYHSLFVSRNDTVWACGDNTYGETGTGTVSSSPQGTPLPVQHLCNNITGIQEYAITNTLYVYPNPSTGNFSVRSQTIISTIEVMNATGGIILLQQVNAESANVDLSNQPKGIYLYKINSNGGTILGTGKIIIE